MCEEVSAVGVRRIGGMAAAGFAVAMGLGRFAFTPTLPLMTGQAGLSAAAGAHLATANYLGYLAGPVLTLIFPRLVSSRILYRCSLVLIVASLLGMSLTTNEPTWLGLRFLAGAASALLFVMIASSAAYHCRSAARHVIGWVYGGIGAGIALSGILILALGPGGSWRHAWWVVALASLALAVPAWFLPLHPAIKSSPATRPGKQTGVRLRDRIVPGFTPLVVSYFLEGVGYIIAGTFLVTAVAASSPGWVGNGTWILVGLAAVPSSALYAALSHRISAPTLLASAMALQAVGMALPAVLPGPPPGPGRRRLLRGHVPGDHHAVDDHRGHQWSTSRRIDPHDHVQHRPGRRTPPCRAPAHQRVLRRLAPGRGHRHLRRGSGRPSSCQENQPLATYMSQLCAARIVDAQGAFL